MLKSWLLLREEEDYVSTVWMIGPNFDKALWFNDLAYSEGATNPVTEFVCSRTWQRIDLGPYRFPIFRKVTRDQGPFIREFGKRRKNISFFRHATTVHLRDRKTGRIRYEFRTFTEFRTTLKKADKWNTKARIVGGTVFGIPNRGFGVPTFG